MALTLEVLIDKDVAPVSADTISFETGASVAQVRDVNAYAYEHHGAEFRVDGPGALTRFYEDLLLGRPLPLKFATRSIADFDVLFAIALFLHRDLAVEANAPATIAVVDTAHRLGFAYLVHLDPDFGRFLLRLRGYFPAGLSKREQGERMATAVGWVRDYIVSGALPHVGGPYVEPRVIDVGTNGFVLAQANTTQLIDAWASLYRAGYLRGVVLGPDRGDGRRRVLAARKSPYLQYDLMRAAEILNEAERAMGELPEWQADSLWLHGPQDGTLLLPSHLAEVLLRV